MERHSKRPLLVIVGPTAVGKTEIAIRLGETFDGEIVSADSRQIYRGMDIATAKPTTAEQARVRHHLIDIVNPDDDFTVAEYQALAYEEIEEIFARGKQPMLVGGTGLYIRAVVEGLSIPRVAPNHARRRELEQQPAGELYARLMQLDPAASARILPNNTRRIIRALEVLEATGKPISQLQTRQAPPFHPVQVGLTRPRAELYFRVDARIDRMVGEGLVDEVRALVARGYNFDLPAMSGLGYREIGQYLRGEIPFEEGIRQFRSNTRKFIRHQYNWFRPTDPHIAWFDLSIQSLESVREFVALALGDKGDSEPTSLDNETRD
jgi:tRNA dimethylallyltransferase